MAEKKKPGRKPGEPKVKRLISLPASTDANIACEAKARKKPISVPAFIAAALESKFGVPTVQADDEPTNVTVGNKSEPFQSAAQSLAREHAIPIDKKKAK